METNENALKENKPVKSKKNKVKKGWKRELLEWLVTLAVAVVVALAVRHFIFEPVKVQGSSMINTLQSGDIMIVTKYDYIFGQPKRFDIITCRYPERKEFFVKRIVGLPGDVINIQNGILNVNGISYAEEYITNRPNYDIENYTVPVGHYFVLGDNRSNSNDSHVKSVGPITRNQIIGHARAVVFPFGNIRSIELSQEDIKTISE